MLVSVIVQPLGAAYGVIEVVLMAVSSLLFVFLAVVLVSLLTVRVHTHTQRMHARTHTHTRCRHDDGVHSRCVCLCVRDTATPGRRGGLHAPA